jgi:hypothetical protein
MKAICVAVDLYLTRLFWKKMKIYYPGQAIRPSMFQTPSSIPQPPSTDLHDMPTLPRHWHLDECMKQLVIRTTARRGKTLLNHPENIKIEVV